MSFADMQKEADSRGLVRKIQRAVGCLAPLNVDLPEKITDENKQPIDLFTAGYIPLGIMTADGWTFGRDIEKDDIDALGYSSFVRTDITRVARTVSFTAMQTGLRILNELTLGQDLSSVTPDENDEIVFDEVDLPIGQEYRLLVIGDDGPATANWVIAKGFPNVKLAEVGEETWGKEGVVQREVTLDIFADEDLGTPVRHYMGGTAVGQYLDVLGYSGRSN